MQRGPMSIDVVHWIRALEVNMHPSPIVTRPSFEISQTKPLRRSTPLPTMRVPLSGISRWKPGPSLTGPRNSTLQCWCVATTAILRRNEAARGAWRYARLHGRRLSRSGILGPGCAVAVKAPPGPLARSAQSMGPARMIPPGQRRRPPSNGRSRRR